MWRTGYQGTGVRDIVAAAGVRPGSFTNHFSSKEAFTIEVIDRYFAYVSGVVKRALADTSLAPRDRLRLYLDTITTKLAGAKFAQGCLIGNLCLETTPHSETLRLKLAEVFSAWEKPFAACISEGQATGEITSAFSAEDLASFLLSSWQGAILRMKVSRNPAPLERFKNIAFATLFGKVAP